MTLLKRMLLASIENLTLTDTGNIDGTGLDSMLGGAGNDLYFIDSTGVNADKINEALNSGTDRVQASASYTLTANVENLTLTSSSSLYAIGNGLNNVITGNQGESVLNGGAGNDTLTGGAKNDVLTGDTGSDRFVFDTDAAFMAQNIDVITDFISGTDKIVLDKATFTALTSAAGDWSNTSNEFAIVANDSLAETSAQLIVYSSGTGNLFYNQNGATTGLGSGGGQFADLSDTPTLVASDFTIQA
jgi:Ca2+-binding RTX toxin-like protein